MAKRRERASPELLVVQFLVPVKDRAGNDYPRSVRDHICRELEARFGGWSLMGAGPLPGAWRNPESGEVEADASFRYEIGIAPGRIRKLDDFLAELAHRLGQKAIWRVVYAGSEARAVEARPPRPDRRPGLG